MLAIEQRPDVTEMLRHDRALREALARHESALGRLRYELPNPSESTLSELAAAEAELRRSQSLRDAFVRRRG